MASLELEGVPSVRDIVIRHVAKGDFLLSSGSGSRLFLDIPATVAEPELIHAVLRSAALNRQISNATMICGMLWSPGSLVLAGGIAALRRKPLLFVAKPETPVVPDQVHRFEIRGAKPGNGDIVLIVSDMAITGESLEFAVSAIESSGAKCSCAVLVDRRSADLRSRKPLSSIVLWEDLVPGNAELDVSLMTPDDYLRQFDEWSRQC